jgi:hypothetical protein
MLLMLVLMIMPMPPPALHVLGLLDVDGVRGILLHR